MCAHVSHKQHIDLLNQNIDSINFEICDERETLPLEEYLKNMDLSTNNTITNGIREEDGWNSSMEDILSFSDRTRKRHRPILLCSTPKKKKMDQTLLGTNNNSSKTDNGGACRRSMYEMSGEVKDYDCDFVFTPYTLSFGDVKLNGSV